MATLTKTSEGFNMVMLSKSEQEYMWMELDQKIQTPVLHLRDKKHTYQIVSEKEVSYDRYEVVVKANGQTKTIKTNICDMQSKVCKAVSNMYGI